MAVCFTDDSAQETLEHRLLANTLDEYIAFMLSIGKYEVDFAEGTVFHAGRRQPLGFVRKDGYVAVTLSYNKRVYRPGLAHRIIAIARWGLTAVVDKEVGHLNSIRTDNRLQNLWIPRDRDEHVRRDNSHRGLKRGPKTHWAPCVRCGQANGPKRFDLVTPERISGGRFGIEDKLCRPCYDVLKKGHNK